MMYDKKDFNWVALSNINKNNVVRSLNTLDKKTLIMQCVSVLSPFEKLFIYFLYDRPKN